MGNLYFKLEHIYFKPDHLYFQPEHLYFEPEHLYFNRVENCQAKYKNNIFVIIWWVFVSSIARGSTGASQDFFRGVRCSTAGRRADLFRWFDVRRVLGSRCPMFDGKISGIRIELFYCFSEYSEAWGNQVPGMELVPWAWFESSPISMPFQIWT